MVNKLWCNLGQVAVKGNEQTNELPRMGVSMTMILAERASVEWLEQFERMYSAKVGI